MFPPCHCRWALRALRLDPGVLSEASELWSSSSCFGGLSLLCSASELPPVAGLSSCLALVKARTAVGDVLEGSGLGLASGALLFLLALLACLAGLSMGDVVPMAVAGGELPVMLSAEAVGKAAVEDWNWKKGCKAVD